MTTVTFKRRLVREKVLQALYAYHISREPITNVMEFALTELRGNKESFEFAKRIIHEVIQHQDEIEEFIRLKVSHWEYDRIAIVDKTLLKMGICELLYFPDIPPKVTINELIEVAKVFSTENSGRFINGVLDAILEDLKKRKTLKKTGRGLLNESPAPEAPSNRPKNPRKS
jgi:N utilization substance protein B